MMDGGECNGVIPANEELDAVMFPDNPIGDYELEVNEYTG
jgi:hypothetical protein